MLIELKNASKSYLDKDFNLQIKKGDFWLVTGTNGSGKTTLLRLILGFIKEDGGNIKLSRKLSLNYLPEKVNLPPYLSSLEYLLLIAKIKKVELDLDLLLLLEIPLYKKIAHLSKGNYQKVAICSALIGESDLIILDEPLSGLDRKMTNRLKKIIKNYQETGKSFLISTHNPKAFQKMATNFLEL